MTVSVTGSMKALEKLAATKVSRRLWGSRKVQ